MKLVTGLKTKLQGTDGRKYLVIYLITVYNFAFLIVLETFGEVNLASTTLVPGATLALVLIWSLFVMPISLIVHGINSYRRTKMIILPNFLLFLSLALIVWIVQFFDGRVHYLDGLSISIIMVALSIVVSIITGITEKVSKKKNKEKDSLQKTE